MRIVLSRVIVYCPRILAKIVGLVLYHRRWEIEFKFFGNQYFLLNVNGLVLRSKNMSSCVVVCQEFYGAC